jgi:alkanesulfonate monooxygenase SsuD/methylene tetrahydromethanopterin reductase-like flavin-dependent oxidoreductase (luciferase family)
MPMKFGLHYQLPCRDFQSPVQRYRDTLEQAAHAETLGFESVWPVEQHFDPELSILPSPLLLLAALAERTRDLRLGIAIVLLPLSHPVRIAEEIATLDVISNGRVEFGIGRGSLPEHFKGFGIAQSESRERFLEALDIIRQAWTNERISHLGRFFEIGEVAVVPKPVQQPYPPIRVAANSPDTFEMMGKIGLPIFVASQVNPFPRIREYLPLYQEARAAAGHAANRPEDVTILMPTYVAESRAQVRQEMEHSVLRWLQSVTARYKNPDAGPPLMRERLERVRRMTYEQAGEMMGVFDTPEACVERLQRFREEFNMGRLICWFNQGGLVPHLQVMRSMELFAAKVMPRLA